MITSLLLLACSATPTPPPAVSQDAQPQSVETDATKAQRMQLTLEPRYLSYDEESGTVTFSPDSDRMSASYTHYVMPLSNLEEVLGGRPEASVTVMFEVNAQNIENSVSDDPSLPQPEGGFNITTWSGRLVSME